MGKYIGFCVYRRSYLLWSPVNSTGSDQSQLWCVHIQRRFRIFGPSPVLTSVPFAPRNNIFQAYVYMMFFTWVQSFKGASSRTHTPFIPLHVHAQCHTTAKNIKPKFHVLFVVNPPKQWMRFLKGFRVRTRGSILRILPVHTGSILAVSALVLRLLANWRLKNNPALPTGFGFGDARAATERS